MPVSFHKVSLTARLTAYMRQFADIPFAKDVAELLRAQDAFESLLSTHHMRPNDLLWYAPIFEVRYKSVSAAIQHVGARQVLELASGLSMHGLALTQDATQDAAITYLESDLDAITAEKRDIIATVRARYGLVDRGNLRFPAINALDAAQLHDAVRGMNRDAPLAVVSEGLLQYLSPQEMEQLAHNIHGLLAAFHRDSVWITPDFSFKADVNNVTEQQKQFRKVVAAATDRPMYSNAFESEPALDAFLARVGLRGEMRPQADDVADIVSLRTLNLDGALFDATRANLRLWTLHTA